MLSPLLELSLRSFLVVNDQIVFLVIADPEPDESIFCLDSEGPEVFAHTD